MAKLTDNKLIKQGREFFDKLTLPQRIIAFGSVGVVLLGLIMLIIFSGGKDEDEQLVPLYTGLSQKDASQIVEILKERDVEYDLEDGGTTILVEKNTVYDTRLDLAAEGLPEQGEVGYEIFDKTNLGMSEFVQKLNYRRALEGELSRTIASLDEVETARVHIVIPKQALFDKDQKEPTSTVALHLESGQSIGKVSIEGIQNMVSASVEGMIPANVIVVDNRGKILSEPPLDENSVAGKTSLQHARQQQVESYLSGKVQSLLDGLLGVGNSEVRVNAELDFTQIEKTITDFDPERQVVRSEQNINDETSRADTLLNYPEGYPAGDNPEAIISFPQSSSADKKSNVIQNYEISKTVQTVVEEVGAVKRLSVAVLINRLPEIEETPEGTKKIVFPPMSTEEKEDIKTLVENAVGYDPARDIPIKIVDMAFETTYYDEEFQDLNPVPWYQNPENIKLFILLGAMLLAILMMYKILQNRFVKEKLRIAFALPKRIDYEIDEDDEEREEEEEEILEELDFEEDDLMLLPAELPDQLLLEGERQDAPEDLLDEDTGSVIDRSSLAEQAAASLEDGREELSEQDLMKLEIKEKVEEYVSEQTQEAVKIIRMFMLSDFDDKLYNV